jgi:hypothetical protein
MRERRGLALAVVLSLIVIMILVVLSVASSGIATLNLANGQHLARQSVAACEAGLASAVREIMDGTGWSGYSDVPYGRESRYWVTATVGPSSGPGQPTVPAGCAYLLARATTRGKYSRQVGILVTGSGTTGASRSSSFPYAIASGSDVDLRGSGTIAGSVKASADLESQGSTKIVPYLGNGRLLAGGEIDLQGSTRRDPSQDMRARGDINGSSTPDPSRLIFPNDGTPDSAPFIADYRFTNTLNAAEVGDVLPNPNPETLLGIRTDIATGAYMPDGAGGYFIDPAYAATVVQHLETDISSPANLDLDGKIHFFPNGLRIQGSSVVNGQGTIVVGNGNELEIQGSQTIRANLLALRWPSQYASNGGNPRIRIQGSSRITGLILAHDRVEIQGSSNVDGIIVAYRDEFRGQGSRTVTYNPSGFLLPGFETWLVPSPPVVGPGTLGFAPGQPLRVLSWQRL